MFTFYLPSDEQCNVYSCQTTNNIDKSIASPCTVLPYKLCRVKTSETFKPISEIAKSIDLISESGWAATIRREFIDGSGIDPDLFEAAIDFIEDTGYWEPNELLGQNVSRQWQTRKPHSYGALTVLRNEDRSPWQAKPQNPRIDGKGKVVKYESIAGSGLRAFLPAIPRSTRRKISQRYGVNVPEFGSFWDWVKDHPEIPIIFTEGGKKSLSLLSQGYVAIALYGVDGGGLFNEWIGARSFAN